MLKPGQHIDRFLVEAEIGRGGMGVVFRVRHVELDSLFALKVVAVNQPGLHARLVQEGRAQARIRHPNVVNVADVLKEAELVGLVMEFVNGPTLDRWLGLRIPAVHEVEELYLGIVAGVEHAHAAGVIHRDLKARNILLEINASTIVPKVSDFGIARYATSEGGADMRLTLDNVPMGTPGYMAPEQVRNARDVDHRADVFALGVLLYRLLCGTTPFDAEDSFEVMDRTVRGDYVPPRRLRNDIPVRMERTILSCLQVDPARRPQSCAEIRDMLRSGAGRPAPAPVRTVTEGFPLGLEAAGEGWVGSDPSPPPEAPAVAELRAALASEGSGSYRKPMEPRPPEGPRSKPEFAAPEAGWPRPEPLRSAPELEEVRDAPRPPPRLPPTEPLPPEIPPPQAPFRAGTGEVLPADAVPSRLEGAVRSGGPIVALIALIAAMVAAWVTLRDPAPPEPKPVEVATPVAPVEPAPPPVTPVEPEVVPPVDTTKKGTRPPKATKSTTTAPATPEPAVPAAPAAPTGPAATELWVRFSGGLTPALVSLSCDDGMRFQVAPIEGSARFSGLLANVRCIIQPEGTRAYQTASVRAGASWICTIFGDNGNTSCR